MRILRSTFLLLALALSTGCFDRTETLTLNPDGSGKSVLDLYVDRPVPAEGQPAPQSPAQLAAQARRTALTILRASKGVDAWADVTFESAPDGRTHFKGTAYFQNVNKFKVQQAMLPEIAWTRDPAGGMLLTVAADPNRPPQPTPSGAATSGGAPAIPDADMKQMIEEYREEWRLRKKTLGPLIAHMKVDSTFLLPGTVDKQVILQPVPGGVRFTLDGPKLLDAIDKIAADDKALQAMIRSGRDLENGPDRESISKIIFARTDKLTAHVAGDFKPLFDYPAEAAAARKGELTMLNKLGLVDKTMPPMDAPIAPTPLPPEPVN